MFLRGLILLGLIVFGIFVVSDAGLLAVMLQGDRSYISYVIIAIWALVSLRWLYLLYWVERAGLVANEKTELMLAQRLGHGWLAADGVLKLGLLGTIVGFILMLRPISELSGFDATNLQNALTAMSGGMAVALYTTLAGLVCNILLRLQFQMLSEAMQSALMRGRE